MGQLVGQDDGQKGVTFGVKGESQSAAGWGVVGITAPSFEPGDFLGQEFHNVTAGVAGASKDLPGGTGVVGKSDTGRGVWGISDTFMGTVGDCAKGTGVFGHSISATGVWGVSDGETGVEGDGKTGVLGRSSDGSGRGVWGVSDNFMGTVGDSTNGSGVFGHSVAASGVVGIGDKATGVEGRGGIRGGLFDGKSTGVQGYAHGFGAGVAGENDASGGFGVYGRADAGWAGYFHGKVMVTDDIVLANQDCAEEFGVVDSVPPGTVLVIDSEDRLRPSSEPYDRRVAGVISGAGTLKPGIVLGRDDSRPHSAPVALMGKVFCKIDADYGAVEIGDLLTSSPTLGHAMKAADPTKAFGAVLGKALRPLPGGRGEIPILVCLQ